MDKKYFCYGCQYFTAMVEHDDDWTRLVGASSHDLENPNLFVLTHCANKYNKNDSEGNTGEKYCPR